MQEAYPNLKSDAQFQRLEDELSGTENRIAVARRRYNSSILDYNNTVSVFPNSLFAGSTYPKKTGYFAADAGSKQHRRSTSATEVSSSKEKAVADATAFLIAANAYLVKEATALASSSFTSNTV